MVQILLPADSPADWSRLLDGGARTPALEALARAWQDAEGLPPEVEAVFASSEALPELEPILALPLHRVPGPDEAAPDPLDLWILARTPEQLVSVAVEAAGEEAPRVGGAQHGAELASEGGGRVERLCAELGLGAPPADSTLFHLLRRTADALLEARRFHALHAVLLVHALGPGNAGFEAFSQLVSLFGEASEPGRLVTVGRPGVSLHFGWARGTGRAAG